MLDHRDQRCSKIRAIRLSSAKIFRFFCFCFCLYSNYFQTNRKSKKTFAQIILKNIQERVSEILVEHSIKSHGLLNVRQNLTHST